MKLSRGAVATLERDLVIGGHVKVKKLFFPATYRKPITITVSFRH